MVSVTMTPFVKFSYKMTVLRTATRFLTYEFKRNMTIISQQRLCPQVSPYFKILSPRPHCQFRRHLNSRSSDTLPNDLIKYSSRDIILLRDCCTCGMCVDPYSGQKRFQTTDIPENILAKSVEMVEEGLKIVWENDILGYDSHESIIPHKYLNSDNEVPKEQDTLLTWNRSLINQKLPDLCFDYNEYMDDSIIMRRAINEINALGIIFLRGLPESEEAVEIIAHRIGCIRNTFYGRTWDVKCVPRAKNVAYTNQTLGLHQDMLYMKEPPGIQFLHCIKNTTQGGESIFSDAFHAALHLSDDAYDILTKEHILYHYKTAEEDYQCSHPVLEQGSLRDRTTSKLIPSIVNYSPPFQAPFPVTTPNETFRSFLHSFKNFAMLLESPHFVFDYQLKEGECVIFNNRRILHGRKAFDSQIGERRLKGCYLDTEVLRSRLRS